jgi:hypothetical protein
MEIPVDFGTLPPAVGIVLFALSLFFRYRKGRQDAIDRQAANLLDRYAKDAEESRERAHRAVNRATAAEARASVAEQHAADLERELERLATTPHVRPLRRGKEASPP